MKVLALKEGVGIHYLEEISVRSYQKMNIKHGMNTTTPSERSEKEGLAPEPRELSSEELVELSSEELESIKGGVLPVLRANQGRV
jgi:hypothetical protein